MRRTPQTDYKLISDEEVMMLLSAHRQNEDLEQSELDPADLFLNLKDANFSYVTDPLFEQDDALEKIGGGDLPDCHTDWYIRVVDRPTGAAAKVGKIAEKENCILTPEQEHLVFLKFNYARKHIAEILEKVERPTDLETTELAALKYWHQKSQYFREIIASANLALVLAMAKRTKHADLDYGDMICEGNMALMRAIDKFDVSKGFKFSTYACRAILKAFSRAGMKSTRYRQMFPSDFDPSLERSNYLDEKRASHKEDCVDEVARIFEENKANLSAVELEVIKHRFAVGKLSTSDKPLTLEEVGQIIGVTKERVRQIQNKALGKLRRSLERDYLS